jgi:hypothetical protein
VSYETKLNKSDLPSTHKDYKPLYTGSAYKKIERGKTKAMKKGSFFNDKPVNTSIKSTPRLTRRKARRRNPSRRME